MWRDIYAVFTSFFSKLQDSSLAVVPRRKFTARIWHCVEERLDKSADFRIELCRDFFPGAYSVGTDDITVVAHLSKNCRKIEDSTKSIFNGFLVGIEVFYKNTIFD